MNDEHEEKRTKRRCGTCTACCTALGVVELAKPASVRCGHVFRAPS